MLPALYANPSSPPYGLLLPSPFDISLVHSEVKPAFPFNVLEPPFQAEHGPIPHLDSLWVTIPADTDLDLAELGFVPTLGRAGDGTFVGDLPLFDHVAKSFGQDLLQYRFYRSEQRRFRRCARAASFSLHNDAFRIINATPQAQSRVNSTTWSYQPGDIQRRQHSFLPLSANQENLRTVHRPFRM
ncbi:hypothetical protein BDZ89DRAFT_1164372 [Hymenopellis radicata]|nr:hypothetical protein BDZ89DRAFT_1164372 [Hymenopellis radicata]